MALTKWHDGMVTFPAKVNQIPQSLLLVKGVGTTDFYFLEVDPATGQLPVTTTGIGLYDFGATTTAPRQAAVQAQFKAQAAGRPGLVGVGDGLQRTAGMVGHHVNDAPRRKGYETYGGSYYGSSDVSAQHGERRGTGSDTFMRLPTPLSDVVNRATSERLG